MDARLTVNQLSQLLKRMMNLQMPSVLVEGEVSGFSHHSNGNWYFNLKDEHAIIACVMFPQHHTPNPLRNGDKILLRGGLDYFPRFGRAQINARAFQPIGEGELLRRREELRRKLQSEGLFDPARKPQLPPFPMRIGVVTSPTGAVIRDIIKVVEGRLPLLTLYLAPCRVQGVDAPAEIAAGIALLNRHAKAEVLIVGRGGGSVEDLWAFNDERVVRAVAASRIPVISAVGHEIDHVLSDLAATVRAATPSHAAELVTPFPAQHWRQHLAARLSQMQDRLDRRLSLRREEIDRLRQRAASAHPRRRLDDARQRHARLSDLLSKSLGALLTQRRERYDQLKKRIPDLRPWLWGHRAALISLEARLHAAIKAGLLRRRERAGVTAHQLQILSPRAIQDRGYALVLRRDPLRGERIVREAQEILPGEALEIVLAPGRGRIRVRVEEILG